MKISRSIVLAGGLVVVVSAWMMTGVLGRDGGTAASGDGAQPPENPRAMAVTVRNSEARPVQRETLISATAQPNRSVEIAAETEGRIVSINAGRGATVTAGQQIAAIDMRNRGARAEEAQALVTQRELEYEAAQRLRDREFMSESQIAQARAQLESARAMLENIRLEIDRTEITAPFDGVIDERNVELGDFVSIGETVATIVDINPLIVAGDISERELGDLGIGDTGQARLLQSEWLEGRVRYIAAVAAESTRTYRVELEIPNPGGDYRAGMSAGLRLPRGEVMAHSMSAALLSLDDSGNVGVKVVSERDRVQFFPVEIVESNSDGIWVTGLPDRVRLITIGQGFVVAGQEVRTVPAESYQSSNGEGLLP